MVRCCKEVFVTVLAVGIAMDCAAGTGTHRKPAPSWPAGMQAAWTDLTALLAQRPWGAADWTRGVYLGVRLMNYGADGLPYMGRAYAHATKAEEAFLAGTYLAVHGGRTERWFVRGELEKNSLKRTWLKAMVGDSKALAAAMRSGTEWQPAIRQLPSTRGCLLLAQACMRSKDVLVRRAGLYWGFWLADSEYWRLAAQLRAADPDPLTRRFAALLMRKGGR